MFACSVFDVLERKQMKDEQWSVKKSIKIGKKIKIIYGE